MTRAEAARRCWLAARDRMDAAWQAWDADPTQERLDEVVACGRAAAAAYAGYRAVR